MGAVTFQRAERAGSGRGDADEDAAGGTGCNDGPAEGPELVHGSNKQWQEGGWKERNELGGLDIGRAPSDGQHASLVSDHAGARMASTVSPELALELRLRFLETLVTGRGTAKPAPSASAASLTRRANLVQAQLKEVLETGGGGEAVRRFVQGYDLNEPLLRLPPVTSPEGDGLSPQSKVALILESDAEIRQLERELREVDALDRQGVVGAGHLADHEKLKPVLSEVRTAVAPVAASLPALEAQSNELLMRYNNYITTLSEVFISWNDIVSAAEDEITKLEKARNRTPDAL